MTRPVTKDIAQMSFRPGLSAAFDAFAFDDAIQAHGVQFVHFRGMRDPVGMIDKFDSRRPDEDHSGASNGLVYTKAGCFTALLVGNSKELRQAENGMLDSATASMTPSRFYECGLNEQPVEIFLAPMDRIYLREESVLVPHQQLVEASATGDDRLRFPAVQVQDILDANGIRYQSGADFQVRDGHIHWCGQNQPGVNVETGKGRIYAIRYLYRPFWIVDRMLHEIRIAQQEDLFTGERKMQRMPQAAIVQREYVFENEQKDERAPDPESPRQVQSPRDSGFGPR